MVPLRRLFYGEHGSGKTTALAMAAADLRAAGYPLSSMLALSVHGRGARVLRSALHERLGADLPSAEIRRRATALLEEYPAAAQLPAGWRATDVLSALDRRHLMRRAWQEHGALGTLYEHYADAPGALDWLQ